MDSAFENGACHLTEGKSSTTRLGRSKIKALSTWGSHGKLDGTCGKTT